MPSSPTSTASERGCTSTARSDSGRKLAPDRRATIDGVEAADSWATDAHKWLNAPYDCGVVICRDGARTRHGR